MPNPVAGYAQVATTIAQLKSIPPENRSPNFCILVPEIGSWVYYSPTSTAPADDVAVFMPTDAIGRWIVTNQLPSVASLAVRGTGGNAINLSSDQGRGLITPGTQGLTIGGSASKLGFYGVTPAASATIASPGSNTTDMLRCLTEIHSRILAVGLITGGAIAANSFEKTYNPANPTDDLIGLLGTVNSVFTNPHPTKITNTASSIAFGTSAVITDRTDNDFYTNTVANSWVQIDIGANNPSRRVSLTGFGIKSRPPNGHHPLSVVIEGSNDGTTFATIHTWSSIGITAVLQWRGVVFAGSIPYRYIRIRQPGLDSSNGNYLALTEIALYGSLNVL